MGSASERDGAPTKIAISAMKTKSYQAARKAIDKLTSTQTRDLLTSILISEMNRPQDLTPTQIPTLLI
jgi:hypothetical protein